MSGISLRRPAKTNRNHSPCADVQIGVSAPSWMYYPLSGNYTSVISQVVINSDVISP
jgi:hypothetical protein